MKVQSLSLKNIPLDFIDLREVTQNVSIPSSPAARISSPPFDAITSKVNSCSFTSDSIIAGNYELT